MNTKSESVSQIRSVQWHISEAVRFILSGHRQIHAKAYVSPGAVGDHGTQPQILWEVKTPHIRVSHVIKYDLENVTVAGTVLNALCVCVPNLISTIL